MLRTVKTKKTIGDCGKLEGFYGLFVFTGKAVQFSFRKESKDQAEIFLALNKTRAAGFNFSYRAPR